MKKLFLQGGKLMVSDFPEYPPKPGPMSHQEFFTEFYEDDLPKYHKAVSAAKASAVDVAISPCILPHASGYYLNSEPGTQAIEIKEGQLYDTPEGWTVEIKTQFWVYDPAIAGNNWMDSRPTQHDNYEGRTIARLIPETLPNSDQKASNQPEKHSKVSGIAAVGVPEYDFKYDLRETNPIKEALREAGIPESGEKDYEQYYKTPPNDRDWAWYLRGLKEGYGQAEFEGHKRPVPWPPTKSESVSPPPQAESWDDIFLKYNNLFHFCIPDHGKEELKRGFTITRKP